ncbi:hypothetical protein A3D68_02605 [Candidatus Adlerbacteria bacterium RIFCSPHIGHO2_02_FULL_52_17]|uniref:Transglycosylase SLT domain-containing protein n=1 Tax=Candidatus Adlerbacteria bacterium RIFCSPHIGHO2_02_FULL_52_17 TaxID=1797240 RepID=A0A1F4XML4_9BACT|nr:MAG: hypothetical protein A3D68_02605 [Candidatus Adlerbacteria bacterium RIFCSPHIGHO2_02_FULL_52_17]
MHLTTSIALAFSLALGGQGSLQEDVPRILLMPAAQTVEQYTRDYFADEPVLADIAQCESHFKQFDKDGSIHRGRVNKSDLGIMQVNEYYHGKTAERLGIDLYTIQGNLAYARYLYEQKGTGPWISSKPCWGKTEEAQKLALKG